MVRRACSRLTCVPEEPISSRAVRSGLGVAAGLGVAVAQADTAASEYRRTCVSRPAMPSALMPFFFWKAFSAVTSLALKMPSGSIS